MYLTVLVFSAGILCPFHGFEQCFIQNLDSEMARYRGHDALGVGK